MEELMIWSLRVSAMLTLLFAAYYFIFRNNTSFHLRRGLVLIILATCCLSPFLEYKVTKGEPRFIQQVAEQKPVIFKTVPETTPSQQNILTEVDSFSVTYTGIDWQERLSIIYVVGVMISLLALVLQAIKLLYWRYSGEKRLINGVTCVFHPAVSTPFSVSKVIFIPKDHTYTPEIWRIIQHHETTHIAQKHTIDLIFNQICQALLWYNPIIYLIGRELRVLHEALADEAALKSFQLRHYAEALIAVSLNGQQHALGHSFASISTLSKRLKFMNAHKTRLGTTIVAVLFITTYGLGILGWNAIQAQEKPGNDNDKNFGLIIEPTPVNSKDEALQLMRNRLGILPSFIASDKLPPKFEVVLKRLKEVYPDKQIRYQYMQNPASFDYQGTYYKNNSPLYFGELDKNDRKELIQLSLKDSIRIRSTRISSNTMPNYMFDLYELINEFEREVEIELKYIMFYEPSFDRETEVFDEDEVDVKPEPVGGLETFTRAIALDTKLPSHIRKEDLPETIDFTAVVYGGRQISNLNLTTELKGSDRKNKPLYLFFGEVMEDIQNKTRQFYTWKRGVKDGEQVKVRVKISIPTKYMM
ncbi:M56 family metallopeptidase [Roseivirga sp.]|uniref:M56 family metallopeptidase n=1 Tax=Roseivirga sp. TaxID=1964215 RepID=UPI003B5212B5